MSTMLLTTIFVILMLVHMRTLKITKIFKKLFLLCMCTYIIDLFLCIVALYLSHKGTSFQVACNEVIGGKMIMITGQSWGGGNLPLIFSLDEIKVFIKFINVEKNGNQYAPAIKGPARFMINEHDNHVSVLVFTFI